MRTARLIAGLLALVYLWVWLLLRYFAPQQNSNVMNGVAISSVIFAVTAGVMSGVVARKK